MVILNPTHQAMTGKQKTAGGRGLEPPYPKAFSVAVLEISSVANGVCPVVVALDVRFSGHLKDSN